ncbi:MULTISPECIES: hypothetical protein [Bacillus]|uniref:Uncharacterized protein n=1 Tax=Bacillus arachidis TaxID=2819290 RepID=A0ABS3P672_9BACI|nr:MULTISPECIES: hypothetical protein [Bacillus]MBO1628615.1 hypothetical protein [Bacillus arachidis]PFN17796.1 hypothetical protein COJ69_28985 [Bacillus cereus]HDV8364312.1 hypothetical protein [Bacillus cereus]
MLKEKRYKKTTKKTVEEKQTATTKTVIHITETEVVKTQKKKSQNGDSNSFQWQGVVDWFIAITAIIVSVFKG